MDTVRAMEVIETTLTRRGNGKTTPIRIITQYWAKDGTLLAECDPSPDEERTIQMLRDAVGALGGLDALAKQCPELAHDLRMQNAEHEPRAVASRAPCSCSAFSEVTP